MQTLHQSPTDPTFVQNPYAFYDRARATGPLFHWADYDLPMAVSYAAASQILRDRRFGREQPPETRKPIPAHLAPFYAVEAHSMLELEPPRHTRLRGLVLRAFTSRRINALAPEIAALTHQLIDELPDGPFDLLPTFAQKLPVIIIARLLGVPESMAPELLRWSNAMVQMYIAGRSRDTEDKAIAATNAFTAYLGAYIAERRAKPADDLITHLIAAETEGEKLTTDELITTCILLLNAGHEATVHTIGNGVKTLLETATPLAALAPATLAPDAIDATIEEILRFDPPLHLFTRYCYEPTEVMGHIFQPGSQVGCLLAAAGRDPDTFAEPHRFNPARPQKPNIAFGGGLHFCVGAPLARLELAVSLPILFARLPGLKIAAPPSYRSAYHFHGLDSLLLHR